MTAALSSFRLPVADLVGRPGASRALDIELGPPPGLDLPLATVLGNLRLTGVIESVVEGLLVRGELSARIEMACARCLEPVRIEVTAPVVELFEDPEDAVDEVDPGYELLHEQLDLDKLVRDTLAISVPARTLCRADCPGLCATCGHALDQGECGCADDIEDPRWAPLRALELSDS